MLGLLVLIEQSHAYGQGMPHRPHLKAQGHTAAGEQLGPRRDVCASLSPGSAGIKPGVSRGQVWGRA